MEYDEYDDLPPRRNLREYILTRSWLAGGLFCLTIAIVWPQSGLSVALVVLTLLTLLTVFVSDRYPEEVPIEVDLNDEVLLQNDEVLLQDEAEWLYITSRYQLGDDGELFEIHEYLNQ